MRTASVAFILSTLVAAVLTPLVRNFALKRGLVDAALSSRKIHGKPIPRLGGIAIFLGFYAPFLSLLVYSTGLGSVLYADKHRAMALLLGGAAIALLGVYDDVKGAGAGKKFTVQFAVAGAMYWAGFRINEIANPFGHPLHLGLFAVPFTVFWIVGVINAMNLIDGLDGLAGGVSFIAVASTFLVALQRGDPVMVFFTAALGGAVLGFLFYNFNPASIFMGDTGSMFLGFVLATTAIETNQKSSTAVAMVIPVLALGLPIMDTLLAIARRAIRGRPLFHADKEHIHHRLMSLGLTQRQAVLALYAISVVFALVALALTFTSSVETALLLLALAGSTYLLLRKLGYIKYDATHFLSDQRRRNKELREQVRGIGELLRQAAETAQIWEHVKLAAPIFGAAGVELAIAEEGPANERRTTLYTLGFQEERELYRHRFSLVGERASGSTLELGWVDGRAELDRDTEIAVELLCDFVATALQRIRPSRDDRASEKVVPFVRR